MCKNILKSLCLAAPLMFASCSEVWDEHYEEPIENLSSLYVGDFIDSREDFSIFSSMLASTGYDSLLNASQSYTVWVPNNDALAGFDLTDQDLVNKTVKNHITRGKITTTLSPSVDVSLLNNKQLSVVCDGANHSFGTAAMIESNNVAANGLVHVINEYAPYRSNIFELLDVYEDLDSIKNYIYSHQVKTFDPDNSVELGLDDLFQPIYDSAFVYSNEILDRIGDIDEEDKEFLAILPTNQAWDEAYARVSKYLNIPESLGGIERQHALVKEYLTKDMLFELDTYYNSEDYLTADSLYSTSFSKYYTPSDLLQGLDAVDVSNGAVYVADQLPFEDTVSWFAPILVEAEYSTDRENSNNAIIANSSYGSGLDVSSNGYISVTPTSLSASAKSTVTFTIPNTLSAKYNIYCVFAPHSIINPETQKSSQVKFRFTYIYLTGGRTKSTYFTPENNITNKEGMTKMLVTQHDFEFANVLDYGEDSEYKDAIVRLEVQNLVSVDEENIDSLALTRDMLIDCIVLEPVME